MSLQSGTSLEPVTGQICEGGICIGYNRCDMGDDGFSISFKDGSLYIDGGKRGVIYGVFELLEWLGFRFFTAECELIPSEEILYVAGEDICQKANLDAFGKELFNKAVSFGITAMHEGGRGLKDRTPDYTVFPCYW